MRTRTRRRATSRASTSPARSDARGPPARGPGSGLPACMSAARRSRSAASSAVAGQIGLKLYHCSGAAPMVASSASAIAWVARWSSAGLGRGDLDGGRPRHLERVVRLAPDRRSAGSREPVLAASVAGPAGSAVHAPNRRTGMPSAR